MKWGMLHGRCDISFFVANANATQNLRCICVATIAIINATQMKRKEKEAEFCGTGKQYIGI